MAGLFGFTADQVERIGRMLRDFESGATRPGIQRRRALPAAIRTKIGKVKTGETLTQGGSAIIDPWTGTPNSETDSGDEVTAYDWMLGIGETVAAGKKVTVAWANGAWYVIAAECP